MAQPFNYMLSATDPTDAVTSGLQQGVQLASMMERADLLAAQRRQTDLENAALRAKAQMLADQQAAVKAFYETPSEKRTAADYERLTATLPKEQADNIRAGFEAKTKEQQKQEFLFGGQVFAALRNKDTGTASQMLIQKADAFEAAGDKAQAQAYRNAADMSLIAPDQAELFVGTTLSALPGGKEFIENVGKQQAQVFEAQLQPSKLTKSEADAQRSKFEATIKGVEAQFAPDVQRAELNVKKASASNMYSQISDRAARLGLDREKFADESARAWANIGLDQAKLSQLPSDIRKEVDGYVVKAGEAATDASRMRELADRFKTTVKDKGLSASMSEFLANQLGRQDAVSDIRAEYTRMRNTQVLKNLPPGPASDKDIAFASKGFPSETADPQQVASFLTGFAKIRELEAKQNEARAAWTSRYRGLGDATSDTEIRGVPVRAGETFNDFVKRYQEGGAAAPAAGKAAAAPAAGADVRAQADAILRGGK